MTVKTLKLLVYCWGDGTAIENVKNGSNGDLIKKITISQKNNRQFHLLSVGKYFRSKLCLKGSILYQYQVKRTRIEGDMTYHIIAPALVETPVLVDFIIQFSTKAGATKAGDQ
jgi:hypothetical protein